MAENNYLKSLEIDRINYGDHHPFTAMAYNNLGNLYVSMGNFSEAERTTYPPEEFVNPPDKTVGIISTYY